MKHKWKILIGGLILVAAGFIWMKVFKPGGDRETAKEIKPAYGNIQKYILATATVQPQNRLEMKPPIGGRVEKIFFDEGQQVKIGNILALMSSTERAAMLDAARPQGAEAVAYWEDVYKPTPLISPIDGEVIVRTVQPGQTVTVSDPVIVLSDRLIVEAQIDETDIGEIKEGQSAVITLDAYPDVEVKATVGHIYHESKIVSNVTIYQADILPEKVPDVFRSGMSANVRILQADKRNVLLVPAEFVKHSKEGYHVFIEKTKGKKPEKQKVEPGISDDVNTEILSGVGPGDTLVLQTQLPKQSKATTSGSNPFMPSRPRSSSGSRS